MGWARRRGDGRRSEWSRLWKSASGWAGAGAVKRQSSKLGGKMEAACMAQPSPASRLGASVQPGLRSSRGAGPRAFMGSPGRRQAPGRSSRRPEACPAGGRGRRWLRCL